MLGPLPRPGGLFVAWCVSAALLAWPVLSARWRRLLAVVVSAAGVLFLAAGARSEGLREAPTLAVFVMGQTYVTERASALASLPFYVMTAACFALGTAGLAVSDRQADRLRHRWLGYAIALSLSITALRFALEKAAAPPAWAEAVGITWLAPLIGGYFALSVRAEGGGLSALLRALVAYALCVRAAVAALMTLSTTLALGSHYDVSGLSRVFNPVTRAVYEFAPGSFRQLVSLAYVPQLVIWPVYTVVLGLLGAAFARLGAASLSGRAPLAARAGLGASPVGDSR
jgi:hypothetical protein